MYKISQLTLDSKQQQTFILPDGSSVQMTIRFLPQQYGWVIVALAYGNFLLENLWISNSPNMLHQFRNQIPFGLACYSTNNREPSQQQDFSSAASILYFLTAAEVAAYEEYLTNG